MSRMTTLKYLRARVRKLENTKRAIDDQIASMHNTIRTLEQDPEEDGAEFRPSTHARELTDAMHDILEEHGRPLHRNVIYERVRERGIHIGGAKPVNSIGSYLSTDTRFKNVAKGMWDLAHKETKKRQNGTGDGPIVVNPGQATIMPAGDPYD